MKNVSSLRGKESSSNLQKIELWTKLIDANRPDNNSCTYRIVSLVRFLHRLRLSPEKRNLPELQLLVKPKLKSFKTHFAAFIVDSF